MSSAFCTILSIGSCTKFSTTLSFSFSLLQLKLLIVRVLIVLPKSLMKRTFKFPLERFPAPHTCCSSMNRLNRLHSHRLFLSSLFYSLSCHALSTCWFTFFLVKDLKEERSTKEEREEEKKDWKVNATLLSGREGKRKKKEMKAIKIEERNGRKNGKIQMIPMENKFKNPTKRLIKRLNKTVIKWSKSRKIKTRTSRRSNPLTIKKIKIMKVDSRN